MLVGVNLCSCMSTLSCCVLDGVVLLGFVRLYVCVLVRVCMYHGVVVCGMLC